MDHYQAGGLKPSHLRAPRMSSDGSWTENYPSAQQAAVRSRWITWSGWLAFALLLLIEVTRRST